jgi:hypothetical protein
MQNGRHCAAEAGSSQELLGPEAADDLGRMMKVLRRVFEARLDAPEFSPSEPIKNVKEFCVGLLENPGNHAWCKDETYQRLPEKKRCSIAASLFLARKVLPSAPDPSQMLRHRQLMSTPAPAVPEGYKDFCAKEIARLFPYGWAKDYFKHVKAYSPKSSSCLDEPAANGGVQRFMARMGRDWFETQCLTGGHAEPHRVKFAVVETGGKSRGVTVAPGAHQLLGPLHRTMYEYMTQYSWCMRGEARGRRFVHFQERGGEVMVSGDYESATDNLNLDMTKFVLHHVLARAGHRVPPGIVAQAMASLEAEISYSDGVVVTQRRGQLMGNFLSFPLLCLQNYLAFRFLVPRDTPVKINGDDIVFRATRAEFDHWAAGVQRLGLTLSRGKTMVHPRLFSLNSSFFRATPKRVTEIPVIRMKSVGDGIPTPGDFRRFTRGWRMEARRLVGALWLNRHRRQIQASGRSVVEGLGIPADNSQIHTAGLSPREAWYRGSFLRDKMSEEEVPTLRVEGGAPAPSERWTLVQPERGFHTRRMRQHNEALYKAECAEYRWVVRGKPESKVKWWDRVRGTGRESAWLHHRSFWKQKGGASGRALPGIPRGLVRLAGGTDLRLRPPQLCVRGKRMWMRRDENSLVVYKRVGIRFVKEGSESQGGTMSVPRHRARPLVGTGEELSGVVAEFSYGEPRYHAKASRPPRLASPESVVHQEPAFFSPCIWDCLTYRPIQGMAGLNRAYAQEESGLGFWCSDPVASEDW